MKNTSFAKCLRNEMSMQAFTRDETREECFRSHDKSVFQEKECNSFSWCGVSNQAPAGARIKGQMFVELVDGTS